MNLGSPNTVSQATPQFADGIRRVALYSHDALGVGHLRRNLRIATAIVSAYPKTDVLLISGACESSFFCMPQGVDCISLPSMRKSDASYMPRRLNLSSSDLIRVRSSLIDAAIREFKPDAFIVDKLPRGVGGELELVLNRLSQIPSCRKVLGLRDILDDRESTKAEWAREDFDAFTCRSYDEVWIYGNRTFYDTSAEYSFSPQLTSRCRYLGYVDPNEYDGAAHSFGEENSVIEGDYALCMCGGGEDGGAVTRAFAQARMPAGMKGVILCGPFMPRPDFESLQRLSSPRLHVMKFSGEPMSLIRNAKRIVCMGGYNTLCEVLTTQVPALVVPRTTPRLEQKVRADLFSRLGLVDTCSQGPSLAHEISQWLASPRAPVQRKIDFGALDRLVKALREGSPASRRTRTTAHCEEVHV